MKVFIAYLLSPWRVQLWRIYLLVSLQSIEIIKPKSLKKWPCKCIGFINKELYFYLKSPWIISEEKLEEKQRYREQEKIWMHIVTVELASRNLWTAASCWRVNFSSTLGCWWRWSSRGKSSQTKEIRNFRSIISVWCEK